VEEDGVEGHELLVGDCDGEAELGRVLGELAESCVQFNRGWRVEVSVCLSSGYILEC